MFSRTVVRDTRARETRRTTRENSRMSRVIRRPSSSRVIAWNSRDSRSNAGNNNTHVDDVTNVANRFRNVDSYNYNEQRPSYLGVKLDTFMPPPKTYSPDEYFVPIFGSFYLFHERFHLGRQKIPSRRDFPDPTTPESYKKNH